MTYTEKANQVATESSVAVLMLSNPEASDIEILPLKPREMPQCELEALAARWGGRNLRSIGVVGLVGAATQYAFRQPLEPEIVSRLADAFCAYIQTFLFSGFAEPQEQTGDFVQFANRLWSLQDPRLD